MPRRLPSLRALQAFEAAARHLNFRRAAEELSVTHAAVSHQIKALEADLGTALFRRGARSVWLTAEGEAYYPVVRDAFDRLDQGTRQVRAAADSADTLLTVQAYVTFASSWLIPRLIDLKRRQPRLQVRLATSYLDVDFDRDNVDAGVIMGRPRWRDLHYERLFRTVLFPICAPALAGRLERPEDLARFPLIQVDEALDEWPTWLAAAGLPQDLCAAGPIVDNYLVALEAVIAGEGIALGRPVFAQRDLDAGRVVRPFPLAAPEPGAWYLVYRREQAALPKIRTFQDWLKGQVADDPATSAT